MGLGLYGSEVQGLGIRVYRLVRESRHTVGFADGT